MLSPRSDDRQGHCSNGDESYFPRGTVMMEMTPSSFIKATMQSRNVAKSDSLRDSPVHRIKKVNAQLKHERDFQVLLLYFEFVQIIKK
jgi:hypothetical protein